MRSIQNARLLWIRALALCALTWLADRAAAQEPQLNIVNRCASDEEPGGLNLAQALANGGDVRFDCGTATIRITRQHRIVKNINVDGEGRVTLDGGAGTAFLTTAAPGVKIRLANITIKRMSDTSASGVVGGLEPMSIVLNRVTVRESDLPFAILNGEVIAEDSLFEANTNAVLSVPVVTVRRSRFIANQAMPIFSRSGRVLIEDSEFSGNDTASVYRGCSEARIVRSQFLKNKGGFTTDCTTTVQNGIFTDNAVTGDGGAIVVRGQVTAIAISGSKFTSNSAEREGGAIAIEPAPGPAHIVRLRHVVFRQNRASAGGAVSLLAATASTPAATQIDAKAVTFVGNAATARGGAIKADGGQLQFGRVIFLGNAAPAGSALWAMVPKDRPAILANSLIVLNTSAEGAVVVNAARLVNATVLGNEGAGLVLGRQDAVVALANSIVENNSGGNCTGVTQGFIDGGGNVQAPGKTCGATIPEAQAVLDTFYAPIIGGPARANGRDDICASVEVGGRDLYGKRRPQSDHCSIGAVEGDMRQVVQSIANSKANRGESGKPGDDSGAGKDPGTGGSSGGCVDKRGKPMACPDNGGTAGGVQDDSNVTSGYCKPRKAASKGSKTPRTGKQRLTALLDANIDYSVSESALLSWLDNPRYTPYPALADALIGLTRKRALKCPVYVDVIVWNYEHAPGVKSPRKTSDVRDKVLRAAIVEGYNTRYGRKVTRFEDILE